MVDRVLIVWAELREVERAARRAQKRERRARLALEERIDVLERQLLRAVDYTQRKDG